MREKNDKRSSIRRHVFYYLNIFNKDGNEKIGWLGDISENGIMIISRNKLPLNEAFYIMIELPKNEPFNEQKVPLEIKLRWMKQDINPLYFNHGGIITYFPIITKKVVRALIHFYGFLDDRQIRIPE